MKHIAKGDNYATIFVPLTKATGIKRHKDRDIKITFHSHVNRIDNHYKMFFMRAAIDVIMNSFSHPGQTKCFVSELYKNTIHPPRIINSSIYREKGELET